MSKETKAAKTLTAEIMATFEAYKQANDERLNELEGKGQVDPLVTEKLRKLDKRLDAISLKSTRVVEAGPDLGDQAHDAAWSRYLRSGDESGLARLDTKALS
ncbi:unnamed protein product, partial [Ectocarpus sp. 12 AP-2014]